MWQYLIPMLGGIINTLGTNRANRNAQESANRTNIALVDKQNKLAKQESELAYQRSSPSNQVNRMIMAGMSRAGAINAINGAGNYTPAPVSTAQVQAPLIEGLDGSLLTSVAQIMSAEKQHNQQLAEQKRQFNEQLNFEKQKWNDESLIRAENLTALQFQNQINRELSNYKDDKGNTINLLVEGVAAERIANIYEQRLNALKYELINSALELPAEALRTLIKEIKVSANDTENFIRDVREGKKTKKQIYDYSHYDNMPNEITSDSKKFKRYKLAEGVYEWREVK